MFSEINSFRSAVGNFRCGLRFRSFCYTEVWNISGYVKRYDCKIRLLGNMAELEKDVTSFQTVVSLLILKYLFCGKFFLVSIKMSLLPALSPPS
jgi:hypothetical protein